MKVCIVKANDKLIEAQSHADDGTLIANAVNNGYEATDIEERDLSKADYISLLSLPVNAPPKSYDAKRFLASCFSDTNMVIILDKIPPRHESRLMACLQYSNWTLLKAIMNALVASETITIDDVTYFTNKISTEEGVTL